MYFVLGYSFAGIGHMTKISFISRRWYKIFALADRDLVLQKLST